MLLSDDNKRYGMKAGNVVDSLNANPRTKMFGIETAINEAMLDLEMAQKNNDASAVKTIGARINRLDKARIDIKNSLVENRQEFGFGGIVSKIYKLVGKSEPKNPTSKDIDEILDELTPAQMDKLTPIEREQLLDMDLAKSGVDNIPNKDIDDALNRLTPAQMDKLTPIEREQLLDMDLEKYGIDGRKSKMTGGLLSDDREQYGVGSIVKKALETDFVQKNIPGADALLDNLPRSYKGQVKEYENKLEMLNKKQDKLRAQLDKIVGESKDIPLDNKEFKRLMKDFDKNAFLIENTRGHLKDLGINPRKGMEDGGMLPDDEMEDEYLDFILNEALDKEEEDYLMEQLQSNDRLSIIFDKVVDVAQEFAGSGPVEGPGSGVSDSIPARLSDGEFVFTAKAVDEIGADNLMAMMKDAEMKADDRQGLAEGGEPEEETIVVKGDDPVKQEIRVVKETVDNGGKGIVDEDEIAKNIKSNMMLNNRTGRHVQS